jgi:hypothetical protein
MELIAYYFFFVRWIASLIASREASATASIKVGWKWGTLVKY